MGNSLNVEEEPKKHKFGGYKSADKPRPGYYKTPANVYYRGEVMTNVNPEDFQKLGNSYGKNSKNVFYQGKIVEGADNKTFKISNNGIAQDKHGQWYQGKKLAT